MGRTAIAAAILCAGLAGCAGTGRMFSYGGQLADAKVLLGPAEFQVYVHPTDATLLVQRSLKQISSGVDGPTEFRAAAAHFLRPVGCEASSANQIAPGSFEVGYSCPASIDLPALVAEQRASLRAGAALRGPQ